MEYKTLDEIIECLIDYRGKTPKKSKEGIKMLSAKTVKMGYIDYDNAYYISQEEFDKFAVRGQVKKGDILVTTEAPLGCVAKLSREDVGIAQRLLALRGKKDILDNDYLMYYLMSKEGQHELLSRETGTTVTGIKQSEIRKIKVPIPEIEIQKKLVKILLLIDEKIQKNKENNDNLYEITNRLYEQLFIKERQDNWKEYNLVDLADIYNGYSYSGRELVDESDIGMATIKNFERTGGFKEDGFKAIEPLKAKEIHYADKFDILVACTDLTQNADIIGNAIMLLNTGKFNKIVISMDLVKVVPKEHKYLIYSILNSSEFKNYALGYKTGTTVLHLNKECLKTFTIKLPDKEKIEKFEKIVATNYKKISSNLEENNTLLQLRDTLLPKLMNGEIDLENIVI
jgi:type I restriction enzyme S subunit